MKDLYYKDVKGVSVFGGFAWLLAMIRDATTSERLAKFQEKLMLISTQEDISEILKEFEEKLSRLCSQEQQETEALANSTKTQKDWQAVLDLFSSIQDYKDAKALELYATVPDNIIVDGYNTAERSAVLNRVRGIAVVCGNWKVSGNYIESRNIWNYDGRWTNWYIDEPLVDQTLTFDCYLKDDGLF